MPRIDDNYWLATGPREDLPPGYPNKENWYPEHSKYYLLKRAAERPSGWMALGSVRKNAAASCIAKGVEATLRGLMKLAVEGGFDAPDRR